MFTSRSEILCGALEECLASRLIHWLHSGRMMSRAQKNIHMSRHKSHQANTSAWLRHRNRDSRSSTRSATVIQGTCIFQRFILDRPVFFVFFSSPIDVVAPETSILLERFQGLWPKQAWDILNPNTSPFPSCHMDTKTFLQESDPMIQVQLWKCSYGLACGVKV